MYAGTVQSCQKLHIMQQNALESAANICTTCYYDYIFTAKEKARMAMESLDRGLAILQYIAQ